jgi:hypothetical protein
MANENMLPLIEDLQQKLGFLVEQLGPLPQQLADFREDAGDRFDQVDERLVVLEASTRGQADRITRLERG